MKEILLFVYGTIGDPEIFERLLKRPPVYQPARLNNYQLFIHPGNGYLFVKPEAGKSVKGKLVKINQHELDLLDFWEDVPAYKRELLPVDIGNTTQLAFIYTQNDTNGIPVKGTNYKDRSSIFADIDAFLKSLNQ